MLLAVHQPLVSKEKRESLKDKPALQTIEIIQNAHYLQIIE